jgi:hypothetical protein
MRFRRDVLAVCAALAVSGALTAVLADADERIR